MDRVGAIAVLTQLRTGRLVPLQLAPLIVADMQPEVCPSMQQREAHAPVSFNERENALVILEAGGIEGVDSIALSFGCLAIPRNTPKGLLGEIRGEPKTATHVVVEHSLHTH